MSLFAVSTGIAVLALIGLAVGLVVFGVVIALLQGVLSPLLKVLADVQDAKTAPMLEHGVKGTDQLSRTQSLANSVPDLAVAYMTKLGLPVDVSAPTRVFPEPGRGGNPGWR
ncbi:MAG TPA: hypothetical protein VMY78_04365 [Solirubrobacteraceae bacterium]|nr:hypothetical protein [Solirubrobacteraceae bacterium]